ncbi:hypothetical protein ACFO5R_12530 [Halosolutus amylolyticus]|uniref:Uncharacterized protein n=1 Tax=Halosolutus amylolyticus TaxID=2932267 RepID=A0ABD5PQM4_9EURY|nr:hypothetical protein [Halosolutus amylolyticus]
MAGYQLYTLVPSDSNGVAGPRAIIEAWPVPAGEPDSYGRKAGEIRCCGVEGNAAGVVVNPLPDPRSEAVLRRLFDGYTIDRLVVAVCNDTTDTGIAYLYDDTDQVRDRYDEYENDEHCGRGIREHFATEWGLQPWTIWDFWNERGTQYTVRG